MKLFLTSQIVSQNKSKSYQEYHLIVRGSNLNVNWRKASKLLHSIQATVSNFVELHHEWKKNICLCLQSDYLVRILQNIWHIWIEKALISVEKSLILVLEWRSLLKAKQGSAFYLNNDQFENSNVTKAVLLKKGRVIKTTTSLCNKQPPTTRDFGVYTRNKKKTTCHQTSISNHLGTWL